MAQQHNRIIQMLYLALSVGFLKLTQALPLPLGRCLGTTLAHLAYYGVPRIRKVGLENLDLAYGDRLSSAEKRRILRRATVNTGLVAAELSRLPALAKIRFAGYAKVEGLEHHDPSRGALCIAGHLGNWEWLAPVFATAYPKIAEVVRDWEAAVEPLRNAETRIVQFRSGLVLAASGGALAKMLLPFRLGLGGKLGSGAQFWSWVSLRDVTRAFTQALGSESWSGACNLTAPNPVTNLEFTRTLGRILHRPTMFPVPEFALKLLFGEMAEGTILASLRVLPERLQTSGFTFEDSKLEPTLRALLRNSANHAA